mmetsp:Transcript_1492/g.3387  ORF Transcript_1492/g.3387 Transcript_1492/m.3387 type:complete len:110 (-) Transcript_1492:721-1050(-)
MAGVLDVDRTRVKADVKGVAVVMLALCLCTYFLGTCVNGLMHANHMFVVLFPVLGAGFLLALMPVAAYASYPADFPGLNLVNPAHFLRVAVRTWGSMIQNDLKVKSKDL